jgi:anti-anti-sigma factor
MSRVEKVPGLTVAWWDHLDVRYVTVSGEVDLSNVGALESALGSRRLHIDMSDVIFIDSTAVRVLVHARMGATEFELVASRQVRRIMEIAALVELLNVTDQLDLSDGGAA